MSKILRTLQYIIEKKKKNLYKNFDQDFQNILQLNI
jgi:hypothetical protein